MQICALVKVAAFASGTTLRSAAPVTITVATTAFATADLFGLPRAEEISDAATHAPSASFQMVRYVRFMICESLGIHQ
ncbi:hypothetical protein WT33_18195 [Burkholderia stagnalis]|nr:hypothetical protein WT33_18195 [Burkholderia stagnalis]